MVPAVPREAAREHASYIAPVPDLPVHLTREGPPETVLPPEPPEVRDALAAALAIPDPAARRDAVAAVVARRPESLTAWAQLDPTGPRRDAE